MPTFDALRSDAIFEEQELTPLSMDPDSPELIIALISTAGSRLEMAAVLARGKDPCREVMLRCMLSVLVNLI